MTEGSYDLVGLRARAKNVQVMSYIAPTLSSVWQARSPVFFMPERKPKKAFEVKSDGSISFDYKLMEPDRPYPFKIKGYWFIAVLRTGDTQATIYHFPDDD